MTTTHASEVIGNISSLVRPGKPFGLSQCYLDQEELAGILYDIVTFSGEPSPSTKQRPPRKSSPIESFHHYRRDLGDYIFERTGISIPQITLVSAGFFDAVADHCGI